MKKLLPIIIVIISIIAIGAGAFYDGMKYANSKSPRGLTPENFQVGAPGIESRAGRVGNQTGGGFVSGEIISKDDKSITVKLRDGGSRIIFLSNSTEIAKSTTGSSDDLIPGIQVFVNGDQNPDGSITAQTIQLSSQIR